MPFASTIHLVEVRQARKNRAAFEPTAVSWWQTLAPHAARTTSILSTAFCIFDGSGG